MTNVTGRRRLRARWVGLAALLATAACTAAPAPPPTVRVDRGPVAATVSASGNLVSVTEQNLGFPESGQLSEVLVKVGDRVQPGQVLARLDDFTRTQTLNQNRAQLSRQQAVLDRIRSGDPVGAARANLDQARKILDATQDQVEATNNSNRSAVQRAQVQLNFDRDALDRARDQLNEDRADCDEEEEEESSSSTEEENASAESESGEDSESTESTESTGTNTPTISTSGGSSSQAACDQVETSESAVEDAERAVIQSETSLDQANEQERVDAAAGRVSIENARQSVVTAQNDLDSASSERPANIDEQVAAVRDAEATVALAEADLENATLRAPVAGVVSAINGAVGEFVGAASGTTALAPGSTAGLPSVAAAGGTSSGDAGGTATAGGGAFMVLNDINSFQLVVPFEEADAAQVTPAQQVEVSVDAVPGLTRAGTVVAVAPTGDASSGIVNYNATILLTETDPRLRDGQTAEASVSVDTRENVLRVPSAVVRTEGGRTVVTSPGSDSTTVTTPFEAGLTGDQFVEVRSGLSEGQEVVLPQAQVTGTPSQPNGPNGPPG